MTWFKVDDTLHSHPKAAAASLAALGLWTVAGSWSGNHLTDGFVPDHMIPLLSRGQSELARELVAAGLWRRARGGYQFHQWAADEDGTPRNPTRSEATAGRKKMASGGALGNHRRWHVGAGRIDPKCQYCKDSGDRVPDRDPIGSPESPPNPPVPSRPVPSLVGTKSSSSPDVTRANPDDDQKIDDEIIRLVDELTGVTLARGHAAAIRRRLLGGRAVRSPAAYIARAIRADPAGFLPASRDPAYRPVREILAGGGECEHGAPAGVGCALCRIAARTAAS